MFDLSQLDTGNAAETGVAVALLHPKTNVPLGIRIRVCGVDSEIYRSQVRKQQNRRTEAARRARGRVTVSAEELESDALGILVACTLGWESDVKEGDGIKTVPGLPVGGELLEFTPENVRKIYANPGYGWLREQVDAEIGDRANFLPK